MYSAFFLRPVQNIRMFGQSEISGRSCWWRTVTTITVCP